MPFEVQAEDLEGGIRAFTVRGELDMSTAPELEDSLEKVVTGEQAQVVIDLTECDFIDSTGIALIVRSWQRLDGGGEGGGSGKLVLCCDNTQVMRLLQITGVESSISVHPQRDAAVADLRGGTPAGA
ncbi:MAG TPA: STAS domain-containing protein [Solirubrobacterales bacterium]